DMTTPTTTVASRRRLAKLRRTTMRRMVATVCIDLWREPSSERPPAAKANRARKAPAAISPLVYSDADARIGPDLAAVLPAKRAQLAPPGGARPRHDHGRVAPGRRAHLCPHDGRPGAHLHRPRGTE